MNEALPNWVTPNISFRDKTNPNDIDVWHVRGIVDGMAVCRRWRSSKKSWHYEVIDPYFFQLRVKDIEVSRGKNVESATPPR